MGKINNLQRRANEIISLNKKNSLGYDSTLDFNFGYIESLFKNKLITKKERKLLLKVYANPENEWCLFTIENGKLVSYEESDDDVDLDDLH